MKDTNCVCFYSDQFVGAHKLASLFLGENGRLANLIDIMEARINYGFSHEVWKRYFTTGSTEWFGLDKSGNPVIAVLHNFHPLLEETLLKGYCDSQYNTGDHNTVSRDIFLQVLDGKFGEVSVVSLKEVVEEINTQSHKHDISNKEQAESSKLFQARFGNSETAKQYVDLYFSEKGPGEFDPIFLKCSCDDYFPSFIKLQNDRKTMAVDLDSSPIDLSQEALGHFLQISGIEYIHERNIVSEIGVCNTQSNIALLAILGVGPAVIDEDVCEYAPNVYKRHLGSMFVATSGIAEEFYSIIKRDDWYFSEYPRGSVAITDKQKEQFKASDPTYSTEGEPKFLVKSLKPLARRTIKIHPSVGCYNKSTLLDVYKNPLVNAYRVISSWKLRDNNYVAVVEYYQAEVYLDRFIPREAEIISNHKLLGRIV